MKEIPNHNIFRNKNKQSLKFIISLSTLSGQEYECSKCSLPSQCTLDQSQTNACRHRSLWSSLAAFVCWSHQSCMENKDYYQCIHWKHDWKINPENKQYLPASKKYIWFVEVNQSHHCFDLPVKINIYVPIILEKHQIC